ncbi:hypothetical protein FRC17_010983 [Serendipita sp. 399]|nr:hypothetical protein FRC17_010983 [Serendipita sp. 399]
MNRPRRHTAKYLTDTKRRTLAGSNAEPQQPQRDRKKDKIIPASNSKFLKQAASIGAASAKIKRKEIGVEDPPSIDVKFAQYASRLEDLAQSFKRDVNREFSHLVTYPDELLSIIFESYAGIFGNPWALMQVCRRWRHVATHTRRIWSGILISYKMPFDSQSPFPCANRRHLGYEICNTAQRLSSALARAAGGPLDICFKLNFFVVWLGGPPADAEAEAFFRECVDLLRSSQAYLRIRLLETYSAPASWIDSLGFDTFEFLALEAASVGLFAPGLCRQIQLTAKQIHTLEIHQELGRDFSWNLQMFPDLRSLRVWGEASSRDDGAQELHRVLRDGTHLTDLSLSTLDVSGDGPLSFPSLQTFKLDDVQFGCRVNLPNLRSLEMSSPSILSTGMESINLPSLIFLELYGYAPNHNDRIRAPTLNVLRLYSRQVEGVPHLQGRLEEIIKPAFSTLRSMELRGDFETSTPLADLLDRCVSLKKLHISSSRIKKSIFEALGGCSLPQKPGSALLKAPIITSLKTFHVDLRYIKAAPTRAASAKWARMAVRARRRGGYPLNGALIEALDKPICILE